MSFVSLTRVRALVFASSFLFALGAFAKSGVLLVIPTDREHPDKNFHGAAVLDLGIVDRETLDVELERAKEVMPDALRPINVAVYVAEDLPLEEQRKLLASTEENFRAHFPDVRVFARYVPREKIELPEDSDEIPKRKNSAAFVTAEISTDGVSTSDRSLAGNPIENFMLSAGSVQTSVRAVGTVGVAKAAISFAYWLGRPGLGWYRILLLATEPAIEIGYTLKQRPFSHWLRTHHIAFHEHLLRMSVFLREREVALSGVPAAIANKYRHAEIPKSWLLNMGIFFVLRPGWGKLVNHWADPDKPSPFSIQFISEIGIAGVLGILFYVLGDKGFENLRRAGIATGAAHRNFLAATSFVSLISLLLYTADPDPLSNVPLLGALAIEGASYLAVYGLSVVMAPVNNRFVVVDERLLEGEQRKTTHTVLDELENLREAIRAEGIGGEETRRGLIREVSVNPKLRRYGDDKNLAHFVGRVLHRPYTCAAAILKWIKR